MSIYLQLFYEFFKAGLFAVGGGMATLPFLYNISDKTGWFSYGQLADMVAISESTPGPIGVNMATYVGFTTAGIPGSIIATVGLITPSIIIILIIAGFLKAFQDSKYVKSAFYGLRPASTGLIAAAGLSVVALVVLQKDLYAESHNLIDLINLPNIVLMVILYFFTARFKKTKGLHPVVFIAASAVIGIVFRFGGAV
ncbi:MAG: chromate transporter [Lachnospiraceae bacterium]|jgi:chromate transporter|nr:chromate transporter [Lachnospiraceae bacterium]NBJ80706.1 chromate transporter [bacterium 1XD42-76]NBK03915.1 chromate transporter [bacterium 1XD42-94]